VGEGIWGEKLDRKEGCLTKRHGKTRVVLFNLSLGFLIPRISAAFLDTHSRSVAFILRISTPPCLLLSSLPHPLASSQLDKHDRAFSRLHNTNGLVEDAMAEERARKTDNPWTEEEKEVWPFASLHTQLSDLSLNFCVLLSEL
jgi:hypothetical protein